MITWVETHARNHWLEWTGRPAQGLRCAILTSARHGHQRCTVLLADRFRPFQVAVKVGWSESSRRGIHSEFQLLKAARAGLPARIAETLPAALDLVSTEGALALFASAVGGARPAIPDLLGPTDRIGKSAVDRYLETTMAWSFDLARATRVDTGAPNPIADYPAQFSDKVDADRLLALIPPERAWQHGDPAPGNVLMTGRGVRLVDWEHASPVSLPWHDLAYMVPVMAIVAAGQRSIRPVEAFDALFRAGSWCGEIIRRRLSEVWSHTIDVADAVVITALEVALARGHANPAWHDLANHLLLRNGPAWLRT